VTKLEAEKAATATEYEKVKKIATQHQRAYAAMKAHADPRLVDAYTAAAVGREAEFPKLSAPVAPVSGGDDEYATPEQKQIAALQAQLNDLPKLFESKLREVRESTQAETSALRSRDAWKTAESRLGAEMFAKLKPSALKHAETLGLTESDLQNDASLALLFEAAKAPEAEKAGYERAVAEFREKAEGLDGLWTPPQKSAGVEVPGMDRVKDAPLEQRMAAYVGGLSRIAAQNAR
jgi:hypothetical protein